MHIIRANTFKGGLSDDQISREILRLYGLGINQTGIAASCGCSRKTVRNVLKRAQEMNIAWPLSSDITDDQLEMKFFADKSVPSGYQSRNMGESNSYFRS